VIGSTKTVLLIGTVDTKSDELSFLNQKLLSLGAQVVLMDVGVMTSATFIAQISNAEVALAASSTIELVRASDDENSAMQIMAQGSATIALRLYTEGKIQGVLALGGSMGTDLALEVASALPLGIPKDHFNYRLFAPNSTRTSNARFNDGSVGRRPLWAQRIV
jgi:uncharacterized protein (UPF0261 family)